MKPENRTAVTHSDKIVNKGSLADQEDSNSYQLDAKNKISHISQSLKPEIVSSHVHNNNKELKISKFNECGGGKVPIKTEASEDDLEFENIQKFESVTSPKTMANIESITQKTEETNSDSGQDSNKQISGTPPKKRKYVDQSKQSPQNEEPEKLFIRLKKSKIARKQHELSDKTTNSPPTTGSTIKQEATVEPGEKPPGKFSKIETSRQNLSNVNKTESMKLEQMLLEKAKKNKERQRTENSSVEVSENSTSEIEIEPYVYEKTSRSVFETYERKEGENGQVILQCLLCPFHSEKFKQMSLHYKFKHKETPIEEMHFCDVKGCKFKTVHQGMFKWHMRRHMLAADKITTSLFPCSQCDKVFEHRKGYLIHLKHKHRDPSPAPKKTDYPCSTCNFRTTTKPNLQAHIYRCHIPDNIKPTLTCNICGYETHYKDCFKKHLTRVHLKKDK